MFNVYHPGRHYCAIFLAMTVFVVLVPLTAEPWVLTYLNITEDPTDWKNTVLLE